MKESTLRHINTELREAIQEASEALQTGERGFAEAALNSCQRANLAAGTATPEVTLLVRDVTSTISGRIKENFTL